MSIKKSKNEIDMLNGSIVPKLFMFAVPLALTSCLQQLFNAADIIVCGRFVGSIALAAAGANAQIVNLFVNSFLGLSLGVNVMIASYIGEEKTEKVYNVVHTSMTFAVIFGLFLMVLGLLFGKNFLLLLGTPEEILEPATLYLKILLGAIPFIVIYNFGAGILRAIGDTRRPLIILTITGVLNVIMNVFFVVCFGLGVAGVAIATAISNSIAAIVVVILLTKEKSVVKYDIKKWMINGDALFKVLKIGIPSAIQGMVFSISNLCVQTAVNSLGTNTIAANAAAINFETFPLYSFTAFGNACVTFMSQNLGALKYDRCRKIYKDCIIFGGLVAFIVTIILQLLKDKIILAFTVDPEVIRIAMIRIRIVGTTCFIQCLYDSGAAALRAMRHPILPPIMVILGTVVFRIIWCLTVFPFHRVYETICVVYPLSWMIINIAMTISYIIISKKVLIKVAKNT